MAWARPVTSPAVSPLIRSATPKPAIWAGVAAPSMISFMAQAVSSAARCSPLISAPIRAGQVVRESTYGHLDPDLAGGLLLAGRPRSHSGGEGRPVAALSGRSSGWCDRAAGRPLPHQPGKLPRQRDRVDGVADHGVSP